MGKISYEIYLYHLLVAEMVWYFGDKNMISIIVIVVVTICVAYVMNIVNSKISC